MNDLSAIRVDPRKHELLEARMQGNNEIKANDSSNKFKFILVSDHNIVTNDSFVNKNEFNDISNNSSIDPRHNYIKGTDKKDSPENASGSTLNPPTPEKNNKTLNDNDTSSNSTSTETEVTNGRTSRNQSGDDNFASISQSESKNPSHVNVDNNSREITTPKSAARRKRKVANPEDSTQPKKVQCRDKGSKRIDELFKSQYSCAFSSDSSSPFRLQSNNDVHQSPNKVTPTANGSQLESVNESSPTSSGVDLNTSFSTVCIQTDGDVTIQNTTSNNPLDNRLCTASIEKLQRRISEIEHESEIQSDKISKMQEHMTKSRDVIKELLIEKSILVRKTTKQKVMENKLRLGQFITQRQGAHFEEKWIEGSRRRKDIESIREEIEKKRRQWNKRKPGMTSESKKSSKSKNNDEVTVDEFYEQAEIYDLRKQMLIKEDKEIQNELERLDRERNLHIREIKRITNEDSSRFKDFPLLCERYLLLNLLGKGGFSEVHKGFDLKENRYVACKIHQLNPAWPKDKKDNYIKQVYSKISSYQYGKCNVVLLFRHALREIEIHKNLNHHRIVKVFDVFDIDHDAEGNDLDFFLKQNKLIPEREAKSIICQVLSALKYLNERKPPVIHYDLKPGNILLGSGQVSGEIKITDFGLSKIMDDTYVPDIGMDLTSQGAGTYWYLPPECFETGKEPPKISSKVDIWSVGVIFYQCLFGKKPFGHNMSQADILHQNTILHARNIVFPPVPKVSDSAKEFIRKCCTYRKELRPDVFQLSNDDYLKPKAQLKHNLDLNTLPGPTGVPYSLSNNISGGNVNAYNTCTTTSTNSLPYVPNAAVSTISGNITPGS